MKATRKTIPTLIEKREEFTNSSGTVKGIKNPTRQFIRRVLLDEDNQLNEEERLTLQAHSELNGLTYLVMSYDTPIAWEGRSGYVYKVTQRFTQTTSKHQGMLYLFKGKESQE